MYRSPVPLTLAGVLVLAAGCEADGTAPGGDEPVEPTPWIYEDDPDAEPPALNEAAVADAIEESLNVVLRVDPTPVFTVFDSILGEADAQCPFVFEGVEEYATSMFWQDACMAESGASYEGYGYVYEYIDYPAGGGLVLDGLALLLSGEVEGSDGSRLAGSGVVATVWGGNDFYDMYQRQLRGTFVVDGRSFDVQGVDWLDGTLSPDFDVTALYVPELTPDQPSGLEARQVSLNGAVSGLSADAETVAFDDVILTSDTASTCGLEPHGTLSVRTADGNWIDVVFDTPEDPGEPLEDASACDGCGDAWYRGESAGTVCVDFTALFDWGTQPW